MIPILRTVLMALVLLPLAIQAKAPLQPGEFQPFVEGGRSEMHFASEVLPLFDAMVAKAESAPLGLGTLDDAALLSLAADAAAANFYFPGSRPAAHSEIFGEVERRRIASELQVSDFHRTLIAARRWDDANALARRFPDMGLEALPAHFDRGDDSDGLKAWAFDPASQTLRRHDLEIDRSLALVVVSHPECGFSRAAIRALEADAALAAALPANRHFVAPSFGGLRLESIRAWNAVHPDSRHVLVDQPLAWTFVRGWNTPQFFFLVDGRVVAHVEGWPDDGQSAVLMGAAHRARALADAARPPSPTSR